MDSFGRKIKSLREDANFSQSQFADLLGINRTSLSKLENDRQELSLETAKNISFICKVSLDYIAGISRSKFAPNTDFALSRDEEELICIYRRLDTFSKGRVFGSATLLLENSLEKNSSSLRK